MILSSTSGDISKSWNISYIFSIWSYDSSMVGSSSLKSAEVSDIKSKSGNQWITFISINLNIAIQVDLGKTIV